MPSTGEHIASGDEAVALPVPVLALQLLRYFNAANASGGTQLCHPNNVVNRHSWDGHPKVDHPGFLYAISEAWAYLVANALVARKPGGGDLHMITRRGMQLLNQQNPEQRLGDEMRLGAGLHSRIETRIRQQFLLGEYELAALAAMREVEIRVRELSGEQDSAIGVNLMKKAFNEGGALADPDLDDGERQATMMLFWGAIGVFKNPPSHRQVRFEDPTQAAEIVLFADLLLRMLDQVADRLDREP